MIILETRAGEPANFLAAPAPNFFFQVAPAPDFFHKRLRLRLRLLVFFFEQKKLNYCLFNRLRLQRGKNTRIRLLLPSLD